MALPVTTVQGQQIQLAGHRVLDNIQRIDVADDVTVGIAQHIVANHVAVGIEGNTAHVIAAGVLGEE